MWHHQQKLIPRSHQPTKEAEVEEILIAIINWPHCRSCWFHVQRRNCYNKSLNNKTTTVFHATHYNIIPQLHPGSCIVFKITSFRFAPASALWLCPRVSLDVITGLVWASICGSLTTRAVLVHINDCKKIIGFAPRFAHCQRSKIVFDAESRGTHMLTILHYYISIGET